jgi:hypothetical protein
LKTVSKIASTWKTVGLIIAISGTGYAAAIYFQQMKKDIASEIIISLKEELKPIREGVKKVQLQQHFSMIRDTMQRNDFNNYMLSKAVDDKEYIKRLEQINRRLDEQQPLYFYNEKIEPLYIDSIPTDTLKKKLQSLMIASES